MRLLLLCLMILLAPQRAQADTCAASMTDVVFGTVSPVAATDVYANGTLSVTCNWTLLSNLNVLLLPNVSICVNASVGSGGTAISARALASGSATLPFNLYRDSAYVPSSIWGTTASSGTVPLSTTMGGLLAIGSLTRAFTVYAKIPAAGLAGVPTVGGADTLYSSSFAGAASIQYAFYGALAPAPACTVGQSSSFSFTAQATVTNNCFINTTTLAFGANNRVLTSAVRAQSTLSVQCTAGNPYSISLNGGSVAGNPAARKMRNALTGETIAYELSNGLDGVLWGDGALGTATLTGTGNGAQQVLQVYGRVLAQKTPSPGEYRDTVTATVYF